jgi:predicted CoA-binding protein
MADMDTIEAFLRCRRLALVGVSRNARDFSRALLRELLCRGYDVVPVNPTATEIEGRRCYATVAEVDPPVEGALLMTPPAQGPAAVQDCVRAGVRRIWFHRGVGPGAASPAALRMCAEAGMEVVPGECPFMFLPQTGLVHRIHGFFRRHGHSRPAA